MIQELSFSILKNHDSNTKSIDQWFDLVVRDAIEDYRPSKGIGFARFLFKSGMEYHQIIIKRLVMNDRTYSNLITENYRHGSPILACSVCLPIAQTFDTGTENICLLITKELPYIAKRQIWVSVTDMETGKEQLILDQYLTQNVELPDHINRFTRLIQPNNHFN